MTSPVATPRPTLPVGDLTLRPATLDDAAFAADLMTAVYPDDPEDPVLWRHWWETEDPNLVVEERYVALGGGAPVGYAMQRHAVWARMPERYGRVQAELLPQLRTAERLDALCAFAEERSRADGTRTFDAWAWAWDATKLEVLARRGYREERRERFWELDIPRHREHLQSMAEASRSRMRAQGVEITTLDRLGDAEKYRKLCEMSNGASRDVPTTVPHIDMTFEQFTRWMMSPALCEDRIWVARLGEEIVGVSMLAYPPVRGVVQTDWTATARSVRGRGVARALKCETVMQALVLGVDRVRTDNDHRNAPILHINESMGYQRRPEMIQLLKPA